MQALDVLIVGSGHAGAQTAIALRNEGFAGTVGILGKELDLPYERPPLSKEYLLGNKERDRLLIRPASYWQQQRVEMILGRRVDCVRPDERYLCDSDGRKIRYQRLVWAAGGVPRTLSCPGAELSGVHVVRSRADVDGIRDALASTSKVVVAGGGYIGLEVAASLVKLGKQVVVIEATERVLARVAGPKLSSFFEAAHRSCGVEIRTRSQIVAVAGENGRVSGVHLHNGDIIAAQMLIVGIGIVPAVAPLLDCGAEGGNGVAVDEHCRTSLPDIYAVGDCALHVNRHARNTALRIESVQNAVDQANVAAKAIVGKPVAYDATPWFWSNQYEFRLQTIGLSAGYDAEVVRGDPATSTFSVVYLRQGKVIALDCVNAPRDYVQGRKLVAEGIACDQALLGDASVSLKSFCA